MASYTDMQQEVSSSLDIGNTQLVSYCQSNERKCCLNCRGSAKSLMSVVFVTRNSFIDRLS